MNKPSTLFILGVLMLLPLLSFSQQYSVRGTVLDSLTRAPIPQCNIYLSGTTKGVVTDAQGRFELNDLNSGNYTLVVSHVSYQFSIQDVLLLNSSKDIGEIALLEDSVEVSSVSVEGKRDKIWNRQFRQFKNLLLGNVYEERQIEFVNAHVAEFERMPRGGLTIEKPFTLEIINRYTGYRIFYEVRNLYLGKKYAPFIAGYSKFEELDPEDEQQKEFWNENRKEAYGGSLRHYFKHLIDSDLASGGYESHVTNQSPLDESDYFDKMNTFQKKLPNDNIPTRFKLEETSYPFIKKISVKDFIFLEYTFEKTDSGNGQKSWIKAKNDVIFVFDNGILLDPTMVTLYGYLTREGIYQLLPFDYEPGN